MDRHRIGIIIPAFNEASTIARVVAQSGQYGVPIIVDDGSTDHTGDIAKKSRATVLTHHRNLGYDAALGTGFRAAADLGLDMIITLDADGQHNPGLIPELIKGIEKGNDVVVGRRNRLQRPAEHIFSWFTRLRFGINDPLCGLKAYRTDLLQEYGCPDAYGSIGTRLMILAAKNGKKIAQLPFECQKRQGKSRFGQTVRANYQILRALLLSFWITRQELK